MNLKFRFQKNSNDVLVHIIDMTSLNTVASVTVGDKPWGLALAGTGMYVANSNETTVNIIDITSQSVAGTVTVGAGPVGFGLAGTGMYVTNFNDSTVSIIDTTTQNVVGAVSVGFFPQALALAGTGMYVTNLDQVQIIDTTTQAVVNNITVGDVPYALALAGTGMYVANQSSGNVSIIDTTSQNVVGTITVGNNPSGLALLGATSMYVTNQADGTVSIIDTTSQAVVNTISVGASPIGIAVGTIPAPPPPPPPPPPSPSTANPVVNTLPGRSAGLATLYSSLSINQITNNHILNRKRGGSNQKQVALLGKPQDNGISQTLLTADAEDRKIMSNPAQDCPPAPFTIWGQGFAEYGHLSSMHKAPGFGFFTVGGQGGFDYDIGENNLIGGSFIYGHIHQHQEQNSGHSNTGSYLGSIYAVGTVGSWYFSPILLGGFNDTDTLNKEVGRSKAKILGWELVPHLEIAYQHPLSWGFIMPFVDCDWALLWQRGYQEKGDSSQNVSVKAHTSSLVRAEAGLRLYEEWNHSWGSFFLREKISYIFEETFGFSHNTYTVVSLPGTFTAGASNFVLNLGSIGLNATAAIGKCKPVLVTLGYEGEFGAKYWSSLVTLDLSKRF